MVQIVKVALCGKMRSGKDTVANYLIDNQDVHGITYRLAFGDKLKDMAHMLFPWIDKESKPRELYQFMNTIRDFDLNVWVKHLEKSYQAVSIYDNIIITDLRQQNELEWCRENGFEIVRVTSPEEMRVNRVIKAGDTFNKESFSHKTEQEVDGFDVDYEIVNDGDLKELHEKVDEMMRVLKSK